MSFFKFVNFIKKQRCGFFVLLLLFFLIAVFSFFLIPQIYPKNYFSSKEEIPFDFKAQRHNLLGQYKEKIKNSDDFKKYLDNPNFLTELSVPDLSWFIRINRDLFIKNTANNELINSILEDRFREKCSGEKLISFIFHDPYTGSFSEDGLQQLLNERIFIDMDIDNPYNVCDFEFVHHFIEAKIRLNRRNEVLENKKLKGLVSYTYSLYKNKYLKKEKSSPFDNKWNHLLPCMEWLGLLDEKEKDIWISWYSKVEVDRVKPILPQVWNRVWAFSTLDIETIEDLRDYPNLDFELAKKNICDNDLSIRSLDKENIFQEKVYFMCSKYLSIKEFCNSPLNQEELNELKNYLTK